MGLSEFKPRYFKLTEHDDIVVATAEPDTITILLSDP